MRKKIKAKKIKAKKIKAKKFGIIDQTNKLTFFPIDRI
jgi:hypothetical protein